jgi:isocitrate dehydrogenase (NAD+)
VGDDPHAVALASGVNTRAGGGASASSPSTYAGKNGRKKVTLVHKANVLKALTGPLPRGRARRGEEVRGKVACDERIIDACAMQLVMNPYQFDVIVTTNLFGDILSDLNAGSSAAWHGARGQHRQRRRDLRGGARLGARHRRQGHRQPAALMLSAR